MAAEVGYNSTWYNLSGCWAKNTVSTREYTPFGELLTEKISGFGYRGEYYNAETGMVYLRARYYEPEVGRFNQKDILRGDITIPVSLNRYAYVQNDPINFIDPSGQALKPTTTGVMDGGSSTASRIKALSQEALKYANDAARVAEAAKTALETALAYGPGSSAAKEAARAYDAARQAATTAANLASRVGSASSVAAAQSLLNSVKSNYNTAANSSSTAKSAAEAAKIKESRFSAPAPSVGIYFQSRRCSVFDTVTTSFSSLNEYIENLSRWEKFLNDLKNTKKRNKLTNPFDKTWHINGQELFPEDMTFGSWGSVVKNGCGSIAIYNALLDLGIETTLPDVIFATEAQYGMWLFGCLGTRNGAVDNILKLYGVSSRNVEAQQVEASAAQGTYKEGQVFIARIRNNKDKLTDGDHYIEIVYTPGAEGGDWTVYNRFSDVANVHKYSDLNDILKNGTTTGAYLSIFELSK